MEINVIRIASFYGHAAILEMLLNPDGAFTLHSDESDRRNAAILGAGEALRYRDLEVFANHGALTDPMMEKARIINKKFEKGMFDESDHDEKVDRVRQMMSKSFLEDRIYLLHIIEMD